MAKPERENQQCSVDQLTELEIELLAPTQSGWRTPPVKFHKGQGLRAATRAAFLRLILYGFHIEEKQVVGSQKEFRRTNKVDQYLLLVSHSRRLM